MPSIVKVGIVKVGIVQLEGVSLGGALDFSDAASAMHVAFN